MYEYRNDSEENDEEKEENTQKYENNSEPIGNIFFIHIVQKRRKKNRQKPGQKKNNENRIQKREHIDTTDESKKYEDFLTKNFERRG